MPDSLKGGTMRFSLKLVALVLALSFAGTSYGWGLCSLFGCGCNDSCCGDDCGCGCPSDCGCGCDCSCGCPCEAGCGCEASCGCASGCCGGYCNGRRFAGMTY